MSKVLRKLEDVLPVIVKTGKLIFGRNNVLWALRNEPEKIKVIIIANNPPPGLESEVNQILMKTGQQIKLFKSRKTNLELGALCRRPHSVSILAIYDFGSAPIDEEEILNV